MSFRRLAFGLMATSLVAVAGVVQADTIKLRVHHFLPPMAPQQAKFIDPWCAKIKEESNGRLECEVYPSMQLGGSPPQLINQARDGVADLVLTLPGYTPGRFPVSEVFELPFIMKDQKATSRALWDFVQENAMDEFRGVKPIATWLNGAYHIHLRDKKVTRLEDMNGLRVRAPSRLGNQMLQALGATPVGMPVPQMSESLSRGVIDAAMVPWEVIPATRAHEMTKFHAEPASDAAMISATMIFVMNERKYNSLPNDLKRIIDKNSGRETSAWVSAEFEAANAAGRNAALNRGNDVYPIPANEMDRWIKATRPVVDGWIADMDKRGANGQALYDRAIELINKYN